MPVYRVQIRDSASRDIAALPARDGKRVDAAIRALAADSRPAARCKKIAGEDDLYRIRVGVYRVLYRVKDDLLLVVVARGVGHRSDAYRRPFPA